MARMFKVSPAEVVWGWGVGQTVEILRALSEAGPGMDEDEMVETMTGAGPAIVGG